jgi:hypothetical protein
MRRHVLYAEQERETNVGDHDAQTSVLALWLRQRQQRLHGDATLTRLLTLFWTLAKPTHATSLHRHDYVAFFQCVAKALVQSVGNDHAARVAARDWLYDCAAGGAKVSDPDELLMSLEQFKEALLQCADLMLPWRATRPRSRASCRSYATPLPCRAASITTTKSFNTIDRKKIKLKQVRATMPEVDQPFCIHPLLSQHQRDAHLFSSFPRTTSGSCVKRPSSSSAIYERGRAQGDWDGVHHPQS